MYTCNFHCKLNPVSQPVHDAKSWQYHGENTSHCVCHKPKKIKHLVSYSTSVQLHIPSNIELFLRN